MLWLETHSEEGLSSFAAIFLLLTSSEALLEKAKDAVTIKSIKQIINDF
jgi:hypothetical protein